MSKTAYYNGVIYTADHELPIAEAFVVEEGRFTYVGKKGGLPSSENRIDLEGKCVIPGLIDSHCHLFAGITKIAQDVIFIDAQIKPHELGSMILEQAKDSDGKVKNTIIAMGIDLSKGDFSAKDIDSVISDRAVMVFSFDGHALLLNTYAMKKLGINNDTLDPGSGSYFVRDQDGNPTGLVIEIAAMMICKELIEKPSRKEIYNFLQEIIKSYSAYGYTTVFEAMSLDGEDNTILEAAHQLDKDHCLKMRISTSFGYKGEKHLPIKNVIRMMEYNKENYSSENVINNTLKMILDGTIEEKTALLFEPYSDDKDLYGYVMIDRRELMKAARCASEKGFSIHLHAIGDKAVNIAIDTLSQLGHISGTKCIAHNQLYKDEDIGRIKEEGDIFFQTTPHWVKEDEFTLRCLGRERYGKQFPIGTMQRNGVTISFGSDSCLEEETANAFLGMYYACMREEKGILAPKEESINRLESLYAYTINGAKQLQLERETGSISCDKSADFVILDEDFLNCSMKKLKNIQIQRTYFRGEMVYENKII
ncbi:MAG: amidohydrolase [Solobacterium sp.]|nr:amidohydrolase [Solobacterium sp.]